MPQNLVVAPLSRVFEVSSCSTMRLTIKKILMTKKRVTEFAGSYTTICDDMFHHVSMFDCKDGNFAIQLLHRIRSAEKGFAVVSADLFKLQTIILQPLIQEHCWSS